MGKHTDPLTVDERNEIHRGLNREMSQRAIPRGLDRQPSAVSREIRRNAVGRHRDTGQAQQVAQARCRRQNRKLRVATPLFAKVRALMNEGWSVQQVAARQVPRH